jgi:hypothetical protein
MRLNAFLICLALGSILFFCIVALTAFSIGSWEGVSAVSGLIAALAAFAIPISFAFIARRQEQLRDREADKQSAVTATREVFGQWQTYNLAVAGGSIGREAIRDKDFDGLSDQELKELHLIFFKMTLLHQLWIALGTGALEDLAAKAMMKQIGLTCRENSKLYRTAIKGRGYSEKFLDELEQYIGVQATIDNH